MFNARYTVGCWEGGWRSEADAGPQDVLFSLPLNVHVHVHRFPNANQGRVEMLHPTAPPETSSSEPSALDSHGKRTPAFHLSPHRNVAALIHTHTFN